MISGAQIACLKSAQVNYVVALAQDLAICRQQLTIARENGMEIAVYDYVFFEEAPALFDLRRQRAITIAKEFGGLDVWIDVEDEDHTKTPKEVIDLTLRAVKMVEDEGLHWGIYTSRYKWNKLTSGTLFFMSARLWEARYTGHQNFVPWEPFGGWTEPTIRQYQGTTKLCNLTVDLNWCPLLA